MDFAIADVIDGSQRVEIGAPRRLRSSPTSRPFFLSSIRSGRGIAAARVVSNMAGAPNRFRSGARSLWNSYILARRPVSKTYARPVTSRICNSRFRGLPLKPARAGGVFVMADLLMLGIGLGLFLLTLGYCHLCDRL